MQDSLGAFVPGSDVRLQGAASGPLQGLSVAVKDIYDIAGFVTGCGNPDWARSHGPAAVTAPLVQTLLDAGAEVAGKTITDELAYSLNGQNFHYGTPANVNAPGRIPGGSSSGSAAAVAGGLVDAALGSDTGGSIRIPASYCGLYGLRPTHGLLSLEGVMPLAPSFDAAGWFAREPEILLRVGQVLLPGVPALRGDWKPGRLLLFADAFELAVPAARTALAPLVTGLQQFVAPGEEVVLGEPGGGLAAWMLRFRLLQAREIRAVHGAWIAETRPTFGPEIQERLDWALGLKDDETLAAAAAARDELRARVLDLLGEDGLLCLPTAPDIAPLTTASAEDLRDHRSRVLSLTCLAGLAELPQITLPLARVSGCPLGISLIGPPGSDLGLLKLAARFARIQES